MYRDDLAQIHVDGYDFHCNGAAGPVLAWLHQYGVTNGTVVDLGCGGGQWLARLVDGGYRAVGIDASRPMLRLAKQNAPDAHLIHGSFAEVAIPPCDAATSLGEPLNYLNSGPAMRRALRNVFAALRPGGVFVFDVRHPVTAPLPPRDHINQGDGWFCHSLIQEDSRKNAIVRTITTFRRTGKDVYHRDEEVHRLKVFPRAEVAGWLRAIGFRVQTRRGYGEYRLGPRQSVFVCRKPPAAATSRR